MRIPKYQEGTPNGGVRDNTRVVNPHLQVLPLAQFPKLQPTQYYGDPRQPQLRAETRTPREQQINNQEGKKKAETQQWLEQRARNAEAANKLMSLTMPSTYVGQIMGQQLTGLPALAVDLAVVPVAGAMRTVGRKGVQLATRNLPKVSLGRNASGKWNGWINVGNYQYRPNRNTLAMNFPSVERRPITPNGSLFLERRNSIKPEDLASRKFFSVEEYGPEPIYTRETVPKKIEVKMAEDDVNPTLYDDITYMNENFDGKTMSTMQVARNRLKLWKESPHGRAINFGGDTDLSTSSWPQTLKFNMNRHLDGTGTAYIPDNYGTTESFLNNAGELPINQETVDYFNTLIEEFNQKTGLNLSKARFVPESTKQLPAGRVLRTPARIYVPNLGLIKHKHGAKIMLKS